MEAGLSREASNQRKATIRHECHAGVRISLASLAIPSPQYLHATAYGRAVVHRVKPARQRFRGKFEGCEKGAYHLEGSAVFAI
jgi:hypothetical protein